MVNTTCSFGCVFMLVDSGNDGDDFSAADSKYVSLQQNQRILSIGQDVVYCVSNDQVKTQKHLALPIMVQHVTSSTQLVDVLSNFGHSISKSQLQRLETTLAVQQLAKPTTLPSNIVPNVPAAFCWDNNDILEERRTGSHTTHCTNGSYLTITQ